MASMLYSTIAGPCKQSRRCQCNHAKLLANVWIEECKRQTIQPKRRLQSTLHHKKVQPITRQSDTPFTPKPWTSIQQTLPNDSKEDYNQVLSVALDQSSGTIAQSLIANTFSLLRKNSAEAAWECYKDLTCRHIQKYLSRDQYKQLIKLFNHAPVSHTQSLEYILTLVEDMKQLGYQLGQKEKLLVMRSLGSNGNLIAMEKVFEDLKHEQLLWTPLENEDVLQKPFNIMLTSYGEHASTVGVETVAEKSLDLYGEMLDCNIRPGAGTTRLLLENIKMADRTEALTEKIWEWFWSKMGMNLSGKTKELDPLLYREMVIYFSGAGRSKYALEIYDIMTKRNVEKSVRMMTALIHKVGRAGDTTRATELFEEMKTHLDLTPNLVTYNALIDIHAHKKPTANVEKALEYYTSLKDVGHVPDQITFGTLIDMYAKQGDLSGAKRLYTNMRENYNIKPNPHVYSAFIECFITLKDQESVMHILDVLKKQATRSVKPALETCNLLLKGLVQDGYITESIQFLSTLNKEKMKIDAKSFAPLLSYYAKRGDPGGAHKVATLMSQVKVKPTSYTYISLINAYAKAGDIAGAENIFDIYKQKYKPNAHVYNALLYAYTKNNEMDKLLDTYKRMAKGFIAANRYTYGILMYFYSRRKEVQAVETLFRTMQSNNTVPNAVCWTILLQTYFESDRLNEAREVMEQMIQAGLSLSSTSWSVMVTGFVRANKLEIAETLLQEYIRDSQRQEVSYHSRLLQDAQPNTDYNTRLPETVEDLIEKASLENHCPPMELSPFVFTPLIDAYVKSGQFDQAKHLFNTMTNLSVKFTTPVYVSLMTLFMKESNFEAVEVMWNKLYKRDTQFIEESLDPIFEKSIPVPNVELDYSNLLTLDEQDEFIPSTTIPHQVSPFALSVHLDSLVAQKRFTEINQLWNELIDSNYKFDEHNWNRYICSLLQDDQLEQACRVIDQQFFNQKSEQENEQGDVQKTIRKRDDIFISNDDQLHNRTCTLLADALDIPGVESMGIPRLRSVVADKVKEYVHQLQKLDTIDNTKLS